MARKTDWGAILSEYRLPLLVFAAGVGLALNLLLLQLETDARSVDTAFSTAAQNQFGAIKQLLKSHLDEGGDLASFIEVTNPTRRQFQSYASHQLRVAHGLQALEWIPRVTETERAAAENAARSVFPDFRFTERNAARRLVTAAVREEYFPVYYVEPYRGNEPALGFDLGSEPNRREALRRAADTGQAVATARITLVQETGSQFGVLVFFPIYRPGGAPSTAEERGAKLLGFALSVHRIGDMVEAALKNIPETALHIQLRDASAPPAEQLLYTHFSGAIGKPPGAEAPEIKLDTRLVHFGGLDFGGRRWSLTATPAAGHFELARGWAIWGLPLAALALTLLIIAYLETVRRQGATLRTSEMRYRRLFELSPDGIFLQTGQTISLANSACARLLGVAGPDALVGRSVLDFAHANSREVIRKLIREIEERKQEVVRQEDRVVRTDGTTIDVEVTASLATYGEQEGLQVIFHDITERKRAEMLLTDSERRYRALVENASDLVVIIQAHGLITYVSPTITRIGGYEPAELVGTIIDRYLHPEDRPVILAEIARLVQTPRSTHRAEFRYRHKNGSWIMLETVSKNALDNRLIGGIIINARDVTEKFQTERSIQKVNRALKVLSECNAILVHASDEDPLLRGMCHVIVGAGSYLLAWVGYAEHDAQKTVRPVAYAGYEPGYLEQANITWADVELGRGPVGKAIRAGTAQIVQDAHTDPAYAPWRRNAARIGYGSLVALPLCSSGTTLGALSIYSAETNGFDVQEINLLQELADDLAFGIVSLRTRAAHVESAQRLQRSLESTIAVIATTVELRDPYTGGHQLRVAELAGAIARKMELPDDEVHGIRLAGVIHDLGKISIPAEILAKPGKLTTIELMLVKTHSQAGYDILKEVDFPWPIAQFVLQHHERLDGSGYPGGLKGSDILLGARILAVADTVEAMSSHRPYRPGLGIEAALQEITKKRGSLYDADAVDACLKLFRQEQFAFETGSQFENYRNAPELQGA